MSVGNGHRCLVTTGGDAYCWGSNFDGEVGDGTTTDRPTPRKVRGLGGKVATINAGVRNTCAVLTTGAVKCWGDNAFGQLGDGTTVDSPTPVQVQGLTAGWSGIGLGSDYACARSVAGAVRCWGKNSVGQLGNGSEAYESHVPVPVVGLGAGVRAIAIGGFTGCALKSGGVRCWGSNDAGSLGIGRPAVRESTVPVPVKGLGSGIRSVSSDSFSSTVCVVTTGGAAKCWGHNFKGGVGNGSTGFGVYAPVQVRGLTRGVSAIAVGYGTTCAVRAGALLCWGGGWHGARASGNQRDVTRPAPAKVLTSRTGQLAMGGVGGCAVRDGAAWCWGEVYPGGPFTLVPKRVAF